MCVHKAWNIKYDTTEMTTVTIEGCIGWLFDGEEIKLLIAKDLNLLRGIFQKGKMSTFLGVG